MPSEARPKNMDNLDRAQNAQFWGLKIWGQGGRGPGPLNPLVKTYRDSEYDG